MPYKYLFLPIEEPITDGCTLIDSAGIPFTYDATTHYDLKMDNYRVAKPFIVDFEFNEMKIIGPPSPKAKWLKHGDEIRMRSCIGHGKNAEPPIILIMCPTCGTIH